MSKSPAFQFYPDDFLGSTKVATMNAQEVGVYVLLLCMDWNDGGFEFDPKRLSRYCRVTVSEFREAWKSVSPCFVARDGRLWNPRLERERDKQEKFRAKQKAAADASVLARFGPRSTTVQPALNSPFPSPAPATTGSRKRHWNGNGGNPNGNPAATAVYVPPTPCGSDCDLIAPEGAKRFQPHHATGCPNA